MEIVAAVAKWAFVVAGVALVLTAALFSVVIGIFALDAMTKAAVRKITRQPAQPLVRPPVIPRPPIRPVPRPR
jgi:ABC-type proline/glycine betaine transport system permease subunit